MPPPIRREPSVADEDPINARILALVSDLGNTVLTKRAASDLVKYVGILHIVVVG